MAKKQIIVFLFRLVMLLIFTFSILPRKYLHDVFSHHTDTFHLYEQDKGASIDQKSFQCDQFVMVADHTFLATIPITVEEFLNPTTNSIIAFYRSYTFPKRYTTALRGPPSLL